MAACCSAPSKSVNRVTFAPSSGFRQKYSDRCSCHAAAPPAASRAAAATPHGASRGASGCRLRATVERFLDFEARVANVPNAAPGVLLEAALDQLTDARRRVGGQATPLGLALEDRRDRVGGRLAGKRRPRRQHLVQHAAERPDVGALVHRLAPGLLGAHVGGGARNHRRAGVLEAIEAAAARRRRHRRAQTPWRGRSRAPSRRRPA